MMAAMKRIWPWLSLLAKNDYYILARFLFPLAFTVVIIDVGEQFLNRSIARSANVVDVLAAFGLSYRIVKIFRGSLWEIQHVGLVLVHDRRAYRKALVFTLAVGLLVLLVLIITATTQLGVWLFRDLHGVSDSVSDLTRYALLSMSALPLIEAVSLYHQGLLLKVHASTLVGAAGVADIITQIIVIAVLLYTPLLCSAPIALPILATYGGVIIRCFILLAGFYRKAYLKLSKELIAKLTVWKIIRFITPLMFIVFIQKISRPVINLIVAKTSPSTDKAAQALAVLTASYPLGNLPFGWLNSLKPIVPAFQQKKADGSRPNIASKKIALFCIICFGVSATVSFTVGWIPGVSVAVLVDMVGIPRHLALLCVTPIRIFAFGCFIVSVRASITGWLIVHHQTKLITPSGFARLGATIASLFILPKFGVTGADNGIASLFSGFCAETTCVIVAAASFAIHKKCKAKEREDSVSENSQEQEMLMLELKTAEDEAAVTADSGTDLLRTDPEKSKLSDSRTISQCSTSL